MKNYQSLVKHLVLIGIASLGLFFVTCLSIGLLNKHIESNAQKLIYQTIEEVPNKQTALLLGALVYNNGKLSAIVQDRADSAIKLYMTKKVQKILVSGDHGRKDYDEVNTIKNYLLANNIPAEDIFMDHAGFDTYDSLYRARDIFQVESLIIVTQDFHLPRSLYLAKGLRVEAVGFRADMQPYLYENQSRIREKFANIKAFLDLLTSAKPKYLGETIPIAGDSRKSWD